MAFAPTAPPAPGAPVQLEVVLVGIERMRHARHGVEERVVKRNDVPLPGEQKRDDLICEGLRLTFGLAPEPLQTGLGSREDESIETPRRPPLEPEAHAPRFGRAIRIVRRRRQTRRRVGETSHPEPELGEEPRVTRAGG